MINNVKLTDLFKDTFKRSTLISIPNISDLLEVDNSMFTKWEVFASIVRDSLKNFEYYYPLTLTQKIYIEIDSELKKGVITGNFDAYLKGIISEDQIVLVPAAIVSMSTSSYAASVYPYRNFRYNAPEITDCWYSTGTYYVSSICKRPFIEDYESTSGDPTDKCAVYYMSVDVDNTYSLFRDEVYLGVCRYLMNIKKNMMLQNMPIELFQGLEEDFNRVESNLNNIYQQALNSSYWIM